MCLGRKSREGTVCVVQPEGVGQASPSMSIYEQVSVKSEVGLEAGFFQPSIRCHRKDAPHNVIRSGLIQGNGVPKAPWANSEVRLSSPASNLTASSHNGLGPLLTTGLGPTGGATVTAFRARQGGTSTRRVLDGPGTLRPPPARPRPSAASRASLAAGDAPWPPARSSCDPSCRHGSARSTP